MGKRELLLVAAFVVMGFVVYQVTSPPADPNRPGWSFRGLLDQVRREVRGNQARADVTTNETIPAPATLREIRIVNFPTTVAIVGEDRTDIQAELKVTSRAFDDAEAKKTAEATKLLVDPAGELLTLTMDYPPEGRQTAGLSLKVPKRFKIRVDDKGGTLVVNDVAGLTLGPSRGETIVTNISGPVQIASHRGSTLVISNVGSLKLNTINAETKIGGVRGPATLNFQAGDITAEGFQGSVEMESRNAEVKFENMHKATAPLRFSNTGGQLSITGLAADARIDGRRTEVRVEQATAAPLAVYNEGETTEVTLAAGGFDIDALSVIGRITLDDALQKAGLTVNTTKTAENSGGGREESRVNGTVKGGGFKITLRATRGDITLRSR